MTRLRDLFFSFAKVGVMTFGGGYAMLPMLQREIVDNRGWATEERTDGLFCHRSVYARESFPSIPPLSSVRKPEEISVEFLPH